MFSIYYFMYLYLHWNGHYLYPSMWSTSLRHAMRRLTSWNHGKMAKISIIYIFNTVLNACRFICWHVLPLNLSCKFSFSTDFKFYKFPMGGLGRGCHEITAPGNGEGHKTLDSLRWRVMKSTVTWHKFPRLYSIFSGNVWWVHCNDYFASHFSSHFLTSDNLNNVTVLVCGALDVEVEGHNIMNCVDGEGQKISINVYPKNLARPLIINGQSLIWVVLTLFAVDFELVFADNILHLHVGLGVNTKIVAMSKLPSLVKTVLITGRIGTFRFRWFHVHHMFVVAVISLQVAWARRAWIILYCAIMPQTITYIFYSFI